jgi:hypothetical protein
MDKACVRERAMRRLKKNSKEGGVLLSRREVDTED